MRRPDRAEGGAGWVWLIVAVMAAAVIASLCLCGVEGDVAPRPQGYGTTASKPSDQQVQETKLLVEHLLLRQEAGRR
jgi:hypothetical protein